MSGSEGFPRPDFDRLPVRTPVDQVMSRGRALRARRRARNGAFAALATIGVFAGALAGFGVFNGGGTPDHIAAGPRSSSAQVADAAIPIGSCNGSVAVADGRTGPDVTFPGTALQTTSRHETTSTNCVVPPVALSFSLGTATSPGGVVLWGPGAIVDRGGATNDYLSQRSVTVQGQPASLTEGPIGSYVSWRAPDGNGWVITGGGVSSSDLISIANAVDLVAKGGPALPSAGAFGLKPERTAAFPTPGTPMTTAYAVYQSGSATLSLTISDNGPPADGTISASLQDIPPAISFTTVRGRQAIVVAATDSFTALRWSETPSRTIALNGTYSLAQLIDIANRMVIGP